MISGRPLCTSDNVIHNIGRSLLPIVSINLDSSGYTLTQNMIGDGKMSITLSDKIEN